MANDKEPMVRLGGLWRSQTRAGQEMLRGRLGAAKILIFENSHKRDDNDPDMVLYVVAGGDRPESGGGGSGSGGRQGTPPQSTPPADDGSEIPF